MRRKIILRLSILVVFLISYSCRNDLLPEKGSYENTGKFQLTAKTISLNESKHKLKIIPEISETESFLKSVKSNVSGKIIDYGNGISIDTDHVIYIENGPNYHTYTFNVIREGLSENMPLENLVLSPLSDGTYRKILVIYNLTEQEKEILRSGGSVDTKNKVTYQSLEKRGSSLKTTSKDEGCHLEINFYYTECSEHLHDHGEQYPKCKADQPSELVYVITEVCTPNPGGYDTPNYPDFPNLPGGGGGGEGGGTTPCNGNGVLTGPQTLVSGIGYDSGDGCTGIPTSPNISDTFSLYVNSLPLNLKDLLNDSLNTEFYNGLSDYFYLNNGSNDAKIFIAWAAQFKLNNPNTTWEAFQPYLSFVYPFLLDNPNAYNYFLQHPNDLEKIKFEGLDYTNVEHIKMANALTPAFMELVIAEQNNTVSQINIQNPAWKFAKDYMIYLIKENTPEAIKYGRIIYEHSNKYFKTHPNALQKINEFIEFMKVNVMAEVPIEQNPHYMKWTDILLCWLFEIGDFPVNDSAGYGNLPTIGFAGSDYTINGQPAPYVIPMRYLSAHKIKNGVPDANSVLGIRNEAIDKIKIGVYTPVQGNWIFGSDATIDTIVKLDGMQFCIGSYQPIVYITLLGGNQYKLTFIIKNKTGWTSGTRGLNDYNGDPTDDSIIPDQPRGTGVHLGGTIAETFGWNEIITVN